MSSGKKKRKQKEDIDKKDETKERTRNKG